MHSQNEFGLRRVVCQHSIWPSDDHYCQRSSSDGFQVGLVFITQEQVILHNGGFLTRISGLIDNRLLLDTVETQNQVKQTALPPKQFIIDYKPMSKDISFITQVSQSIRQSQSRQFISFQRAKIIRAGRRLTGTDHCANLRRTRKC